MKEIFQGDQSSQSGPVRGKVKWFDPVKGFGFILADSGGSDILLHVNVLRNFGQNSVAEGAGITFTVSETSRGIQAAEVLSIKPPLASEYMQEDENSGLAPEELAALPLEPARVKWFDKSKGFGFANVFGRNEDVFIHVEVLRRWGFCEVQPGEALTLRITDGDRGRLAVQVAPWEAALRGQDLGARGPGSGDDGDWDRDGGDRDGGDRDGGDRDGGGDADDQG